MVTKSIQVSGVSRDWDQLYSVLSLCCVAKIPETFFLWNNYFCSCSQAVYWAFFGSAALGLLACQRAGSVQRSLTYTEVQTFEG